MQSFQSTTESPWGYLACFVAFALPFVEVVPSMAHMTKAQTGIPRLDEPTFGR